MTSSWAGIADPAAGWPGSQQPPWAARVWATWLDLVVLVLPVLPFVAFAQLTAVPKEYGEGVDLTSAGIVAAWVSVLLYLVLWCWNRYVRQARSGQSIGKRRHGLRVVDAHGRTPTPARLLVRDLAHVLDVLPGCLGLLWPIWDRRGQTFADKIARTVVVVRPGRDAPGAVTGAPR